MNIILILDTETTGLDPAKDELCEVAWAFWDVDYQALLESGSSLVAFEGTPPEMTGIPAKFGRWAPNKDRVFGHLDERGAHYDTKIVVAHHAAFDRQWVQLQRPMTWVCSMEDIEWPMRSNSRSLTALALAHGVGVTWAHRALADVMTLVQVFERACEHHLNGPEVRCEDCGSLPWWDPTLELERARRPKATYVASVSYDNRQLAKDAGFQWDAPRKQWRRSMFKDKVNTLPFPVIEVT